ncbi:MAG: sulfatase [Deltaproteobacteria bacterium]|nr:sulfatase [Deltaproteobacteria bacterium]
MNLRWPLVLLSAGAAACSTPDPRPNVLIVSLDTLRADRVGARDANGVTLTPNLDRFAAEAAVFTSAYSHANETLYSHAALFTGRYASDLAAVDYQSFDIASTPTLASILRAAGYRTEAIVAGGHLAPEFGLHVGFHRYASGQDFGSFQQTVPLALERLDALDEQDAPWLLFVHGYDAHAPYITWGPLFGSETPGYDGPLREASLIPWTFEQILDDHWYPGFAPSFVERDERSMLDPALFDALAAWAAAHPEDARALGPEDVAFIRGLYDASVRYADLHVGRLLDALAERGTLDDTLVVVLSDHGEDLLEHGHVNHRLSLHDENLHVPLMVRGPGVTAGRFDDPKGLVDVLPTVAALVGAEAPPGRGKLLWASDAERAILSEAERGELSVRTRSGRLSLPRTDAAGDHPPPTAPPRAFVTGPDGAPVPWEAPLTRALFTRLREVSR